MATPRKRAKQKPQRRRKQKQTLNLRPLRIEVDVWAKNVDEQGETIGEVCLGRVGIFAPMWAKTDTIIKEHWPTLVAETRKQLET